MGFAASNIVNKIRNSHSFVQAVKMPRIIEKIKMIIFSEILKTPIKIGSLLCMCLNIKSHVII